ncbi:hypothetical protein LOZ12_003167 [Ophidiomyces ophidiicola]|uniref:Uncharacterized protein n=1 Tax=Ophidiomyces ophidiicola TaxID=1387563 RepID=A0ACB8US21_9EURO|nr:uncharacterized protein LOZ57_001101 [Ophidiomyces ophidiicola]KAI1916882.1 hypothetical protein LOZ61_000784 [Ophidiomyces ophidiicola]KAI1917043.1 hypothetical protein LOZ64_003194 [Ophidiomyces ophidiicola]KAI1926758.1 hypothetical protein LOZ60_003461 [Ophidiomyces ophidiicola]KAI1947717.1 hypothetical protein LOZ62_002927 [Ophidiomyces ophidiicola]KAI1951690.1 hypothetical protein LOZ57_001101 [Ophidiomyces ophidiicola]
MASSSVTTVINGNEVQLASLETVDYIGVLIGREEDIAKLYTACRTKGIFCLDMRDTALFYHGYGYLQLLKKMYKFHKEYFNHPMEVKLESLVGPSIESGYHSQPDRETFEIPFDSLGMYAPGKFPKPLDDVAVYEFMHMSQAVMEKLIESLSASLCEEFPDIPSPNTLHNDRYPSASGLKMESFPTVDKIVPSSEQTDGGTLTLRLCNTPIIEIQDEANPDGWSLIQPPEGHAIVNVGNCLEKLSDGKFKSAPYRIGQIADGTMDRRCIVYSLRPETKSGVY